MLGIISPTSGLNAILGAAARRTWLVSARQSPLRRLAAAYRMGCRRRCQPKRPTREVAEPAPSATGSLISGNTIGMRRVFSSKAEIERGLVATITSGLMAVNSATCPRFWTQRSRWSEGRGPRGIRTSKARTRTQSQARVSQALERIRQLAVPSHTRGRSRMRESRTYGSGRGACHETHVPTATEAARLHCGACRRDGFRPIAARAQQQAERIRHVGVLAGHEKYLPEFDGLREQLRELGYIEGKSCH